MKTLLYLIFYTLITPPLLFIYFFAPLALFAEISLLPFWISFLVLTIFILALFLAHLPVLWSMVLSFPLMKLESIDSHKINLAIPRVMVTGYTWYLLFKALVVAGEHTYFARITEALSDDWFILLVFVLPHVATSLFLSFQLAVKTPKWS
jgi:hypothetical protein